MKSAKWMRTGVLVIALSSVVGVMGVLACGPSAPAQPSGNGNAVAENVSAPATEAPFAVQQSDDGDRNGGEDESTETPTPTATRYIPPTADPSLCENDYIMTYNHEENRIVRGALVGTRCPPDGDPKVGHLLRRQYNQAMRKSAARGARGETGVAEDFPHLDLMVQTTTAAAATAVEKLFKSSGVRKVSVVGSSIYAKVDIGLVPQLLAIEGVEHVDAPPMFLQTRDPRPQRLEGWRHESDLVLRYMAVARENRSREQRGEPPVSEYPDVRVLITVHIDFVDGVVEFLEANSGENITWTKGERDVFGGGEGTVKVDMSLELMRHFRAQPGILNIEEIKSGSDSPDGPTGRSMGSDTKRQAPATTLTPTPAVEVMRADQWHRAGFAGGGVAVAVIDAGFENFEARVLPLLSEPVHFRCYYVSGTDVLLESGVLSPAGSSVQPTGDFSKCENGDSHGTDVAMGLAEIAPGVKLYISNPDVDQRVEVLNWLTRGVRDDVKILNISIDQLWDGPGNGNVGIDFKRQSRLLSVVDTAVREGILVVGVSGNSGNGTWFRYDRADVTTGTPKLVRMDSRSTNICVPIVVARDEHNTFQLRWKDSWPKVAAESGGTPVAGASTDLNLVLLRPVGSGYVAVNDPDLMNVNLPQSGGVGHLPLEVLSIPANAVPAGNYCIGVEFVSGSSVGWVQLQKFDGLASFPYWSPGHSIGNPGESANDGMLTVGATDDMGMDVFDFSGKGPAPEPTGRQVLDFVAPGFNPNDENDYGTSFAAPRVAGLAALVIGALGDRPEFDEPHEIAQYLKEYGSAQRGSTSGCNHDWGCGFAIAPALAPPTDLELEHDGSCGILRVTSDLPTPPFRARKSDYVYDLKEVGTLDRDVSTLRVGRNFRSTTGDLRGRFAGGKTYDVRAYGCALGVPGKRLCGAVSETSNQVTLPQTVCKPKETRNIGGRRIHTLIWNLEPNATAYEVEERVDGQYRPVSNVKNGYVVVEGRNFRQSYSYRVRAKGPSGDSAWAYFPSVRNTGSSPSKPTVADISSDDSLTQSDGLLRWYRGAHDALYEVSVFDETSRDWRTLPFRPAGWSEEYEVEFEYGPQSVLDPGPVVIGKLTGLVPGTDYQVRVRSRSGNVVSDWSDTVTVTTLGTRPPNALKTPPSGLTTNVSGPDVNLSWTAGENPNYVHQLVRRRVVGVSPLAWTDVQVGVEVAEYVDTTAAAGTEYVYLIRAVKASGGTTDSKGSSILVPPAPRNLAATVTGTTVSLTWDAHNNPNHERQVLLRRVAGGRPVSWTEFSVGLNDTSYSDTTVVSGTKYIYRVRVVGPNWKDLDSQPVAVTVP